MITLDDWWNRVCMQGKLLIGWSCPSCEHPAGSTDTCVKCGCLQHEARGDHMLVAQSHGVRDVLASHAFVQVELHVRSEWVRELR